MASQHAAGRDATLYTLSIRRADAGRDVDYVSAKPHADERALVDLCPAVSLASSLRIDVTCQVNVSGRSATRKKKKDEPG